MAIESNWNDRTFTDTSKVMLSRNTCAMLTNASSAPKVAVRDQNSSNPAVISTAPIAIS
jgi:hypothetical protein